MEPEKKVCESCQGVGLVSTGAVSNDLSAGSKIVCAVCAGTGKSGDVSEDVSNVDSQPEDGSEEAQGDVSPKVEGSASGEGSGEASGIEPKVGDVCLTADDRPGTLQPGENGFVCVADEAPAA